MAVGQMKAAVLYELGKPLSIENNIEYSSLNRGQVLIKSPTAVFATAS